MSQDTTRSSTPGTAWRWLESTRHLQEGSFGVVYAELRDDALADYITWNIVALIAEVSEFLNECQWKTWAPHRGQVERDLAARELVDAAHFIANLAVAIGVDDDEWERLYREKQQVNADRQAAGYTGTDKCPTCKRDRATTARWNEGYDGEAGVVEPFQYCPCGFVYPDEVS